MTVEFRLPSPEHERIPWVHSDHFTACVGPLEESLRALNVRIAGDGLPQNLYVNGYAYGRAFEMRPADGPQDESIVLGWRHTLDEVERVVAALDGFDPASVPAGGWRQVLEAHERDFWAAFGAVHRDTMGQVFPASALWVRLYVARFGEGRREDALTMLGGFPNASTQRASALWALSRIAAADADVRAAVEADALPSDDREAARAFRAGFAALLDGYGDTTNMHLLDMPTWREDPTTPLRMVAAMTRQPDEQSPEAAEARAAARREVLEADLVALDTGADAEVTLLRQVYRVARHLAPASEDHNLLCDQRMIAAAHRSWLRLGGVLVERGALGAAGDVFSCTLDELVETLEGGPTVPAVEIAARRARQAAWRAVTPPSRLGVVEDEGLPPRTLRGVAASRGVHRGRARVIAALDAAVGLEPGDVLVCAATSPEWTPYFGVVGALVTASGGLLTHAAVVAREFGIPAVVGANGATTQIRDGATVVVDGSKGVVTILDD